MEEGNLRFLVFAVPLSWWVLYELFRLVSFLVRSIP